MIKVLHKALNILELLSRNPQGMTLSAIAAEIGEKPTTVSNILQVLYRRGYLDKGVFGYRLGVSAYLLTGSTAGYDTVLPAVAREPLEQLTEETHAAAVLSVWRGMNRYVLLRVADTSSVTVNDRYPAAAEVYCTATGMVLLAHQPSDVVREYIAQNGVPDNASPTDDTVDAFCAELARIRESGCLSRERGEVFEAACPVAGPDGTIVTAVGIFLPRFRAGDREVLCQRLRQCASRMETSLRGENV